MPLAYIDARNVMDRLDDVVGAGNWTNIIDDQGTTATCSISIYCPYRDKWIHKTDGAGDTKVEKDKGRISDAFKRSAVHWGIGRYLYSLENRWVELVDRKIPPHELENLRKHLQEVTEMVLEGIKPPPHVQAEVEAERPEPIPAQKEYREETTVRKQTSVRATENKQPISEKQMRMLMAKARTAGESRSVHGYRVMDDALESVGLPRTPRGEDIKEHVLAVVGRNFMDSLIHFIDSYGEDFPDEFGNVGTNERPQDDVDDLPPF